MANTIYTIHKGNRQWETTSTLMAMTFAEDGVAVTARSEGDEQ